MDPAPLKRWSGYLFIAIATIVLITLLWVLSRSVEGSAQFNRWQVSILVFSTVSTVGLAALTARRIYQLVRDYRNHVPGSRLAARTVAIFGTLAIVPMLVIFLFSLSFLNRGIDSWFKVEIRAGLREARDQSEAAFTQRKLEQSRRTESLAIGLRDSTNASLAILVESARRAVGARDLLVFGSNGEVLAESSASGDLLLDTDLPRELLMQVRAGQPYMNIDPVDDVSYVIVTAAPIPDSGVGERRRFLVVRQDLPPELAALANAVQQALTSYSDLALAREPMKLSFRITLILVLLLAMFAAVFLAIRSARRLTQPVHDLIQGTRAVGKGDFGMRLPLPSRDEMGFLVQSFNDMTKRLRRASQEASRSRELVEEERERLAVILAGLSTGVIVIDTERRLRLANAAADAIFGAPLEEANGRELSDLGVDSPRLAAFAQDVAGRLDAGMADWQEEISLPPDRVLRCACAPLVDAGGEAGHVLVFDDITHLLHAQRDAAWGEVARRLAHEIKNPLTPIQLAAERLRRRLQGTLAPVDAELLERATHTIVQQVESLKGMVNAFSEYARAPELKLVPLDLNALMGEVVELYRAQETPVVIEVQADPALPLLSADRGRLRQVLNNLITNGLEAVEGITDGRVIVTTEYNSGPGGDSAVIMVTDNGHGFDKEMLARVFEPYVTSKPRGTGLGLAIVKKIAEEHGGSIEANNRPEAGAYVRVVLPLAAREESAQPARGIA